LDLNYSEDQVLLRDSAQRFLAREYKPGRAGMWGQFAELGWLALPFSEAQGGLGGTAVETALLMEEFGAALVVEPYIATVLMGGALLGGHDDSLQQVMSGEQKIAFGHSGHATAHRRGAEWRLEGRKTTVLGAPLADLLMVSAEIEAGRTGLFMLPAGAAVQGFNAVDGSSFGDIALAGSATLLDDDAAEFIAAVLDRATIALCADALGAMRVLVDATVEYSKTRVQFGQPIGRFQALTHRMADMAVLLEEAGAAVLFAVLNANAPAPERARATSAAKAKLGRCARFIGQQAVQIHGGMGVTEELNIGAYFKRLTVFEMLFGNTAFHLRRYAALGLGTEMLAESLHSDKEVA
jgi:alkylation response protein AidB-like acyl-CoA dehydrogenase